MEIIVLGLALLAIGWLASIVVRLQLKANRLGRLAIRDGLTGVYNHREIERLLQEAVARANRKNVPVSAIMLDIDHFKGTNDEFGHAAGDLVLREVGRVLRECLELGELIGRWGGEEFLIILPGVELNNAVGIAERLRLHVAALSLSFGMRITISLGVACRITGNPDELFLAADGALLKAKTGGRNRVVS